MSTSRSTVTFICLHQTLARVNTAKHSFIVFYLSYFRTSHFHAMRKDVEMFGRWKFITRHRYL